MYPGALQFSDIYFIQRLKEICILMRIHILLTNTHPVYMALEKCVFAVFRLFRFLLTYGEKHTPAAPVLFVQCV